MGCSSLSHHLLLIVFHFLAVLCVILPSVEVSRTTSHVLILGPSFVRRLKEDFRSSFDPRRGEREF